MSLWLNPGGPCKFCNKRRLRYTYGYVFGRQVLVSPTHGILWSGQTITADLIGQQLQIMTAHDLALKQPNRWVDCSNRRLLQDYVRSHTLILQTITKLKNFDSNFYKPNKLQLFPGQFLSTKFQSLWVNQNCVQRFYCISLRQFFP